MPRAIKRPVSPPAGARACWEESVPLGTRTIPMRQWEAEALLHAASWVALLRGLGLGLAAITGAFACIPLNASQAHRVIACALLAGTFVTWGVGVLLRRRRTRAFLTVTVLTWVLLLLMDLPRALGAAEAFDLSALRSQPILLPVLPALLLPDLFILYALWRRDGREAFRASSAPLAPVLCAPSGPSTGRTLAARGLLALALLSDAALLLLGPGLLLTIG